MRARATRSGSSLPTPRVAVIGAGFAGIAAGHKLKRAGIESFTILERSMGIGGTWWENRYPGAEVDTPSIIYSLSFARYPWTRSHAQQPELQKYLEFAVDQAGLRPHLRLDIEVRAATWQPRSSCWQLTYGNGDVEEFDAVISAVGFLNVPAIPDWARDSAFQGQIVHSARWPDSLDLTDRTVAVVGTGSTAVQIIGEIAQEVNHLIIFQRQPNWILPKGAIDYDQPEQLRNSRPRSYALNRMRGFRASEDGRVGGKQAMAGAAANIRGRAKALAHLEHALANRPKLIEALRPDYPFNGKRPVINDTFYPALLRDNVSLIPRAVRGLNRRGVLDASGEEHPVDIVVLATGFRASEYLHELDVVGRDGCSLKDSWHGEPQAMAGITVPGFPNFFIMYGPNTNAGPVPFFLECQAEFAARALRRAWRQNKHTIDTRPVAMRAYNNWIQQRLSRTVWGDTPSYFTSASGRVVTQWPTGAKQYWLTTRLLRQLGLRFKRSDDNSSIPPDPPPA